MWQSERAEKQTQTQKKQMEANCNSKSSLAETERGSDRTCRWNKKKSFETRGWEKTGMGGEVLGSIPQVKATEESLTFYKSAKKERNSVDRVRFPYFSPE